MRHAYVQPDTAHANQVCQCYATTPGSAEVRHAGMLQSIVDVGGHTLLRRRGAWHVIVRCV